MYYPEPSHDNIQIFQNKILKYDYPTQILKYTSMLFFHLYSNQWIKQVALNESVHILPFPINVHYSHEMEIMQLLASKEYQVCLEGNTFDDISYETADKVQLKYEVDAL